MKNNLFCDCLIVYTEREIANELSVKSIIDYFSGIKNVKQKLY